MLLEGLTWCVLILNWMQCVTIVIFLVQNMQCKEENFARDFHLRASLYEFEFFQQGLKTTYTLPRLGPSG